VPVGAVTLEDGAYDNMLALSDDGHHWRVRETCTEVRMENDMLVSTWSLWPDVSVRTWLFFDAEWQVRVHRLKTGRQLFSAEAGHAIPRLDLQIKAEEHYWQVDQGLAAVIHPDTAAGIVDPCAKRTGTIVVVTPNSNLLHPRTILPTLRGTHAPGVHWLVSLLPIPCSPSLFSKLLKPDAEMKIHRHPGHLALRLPGGQTAFFMDEAQTGENKDPESRPLVNDEQAPAISEETVDVCG